MLQKKKKLSKKEIKEDTLITFYKSSRNFFEDNKNKILMYSGVLVLVAALVYLYSNEKAKENETAGLELSRVMDLYDQGQYLEAIEGKQGSNIKGLKLIVEEFDGTENGETAKIYLANCYSFLGNYEEAFKYFDDYSGSIDYFEAASLAGQAGYYAMNQNFEKFDPAHSTSKFNSRNNRKRAG